MLTIALELLCILTKDLLEHVGCYDSRIHIPHLIESLSVGHHETTLSAEWVLDLHVHNVLKSLV
mgnify:CR=1 FL=1|jgi:hypothetical protein